MTRILSYSPSVEAYVAASDGYYDVSPDIVRCSVNRQENGNSTFNLSLQNKSGKYNGRFMPMDRITIYATKKGNRQQLLTGYIGSVTGFTLYPQDFTITGFCSLYQLQKLYWDPGLLESQQLLMRGDWTHAQDAGMTALAYRLITQVGGWAGENVLVDAGCPVDVMNWAKELYRSQKTDADALSSDIAAFYAMLADTNSSVMTTASSSGGGTIGSSSTKNRGRMDRNASATQQLVATNAENNNGTYGTVANMCAAWVSGIYDASGLGYPGGNAIDYWTAWGDEAHFGDMNAPMGSTVVGSGWPYSADGTNPYGHVGIVISGGRVADNIGSHRISESVEAWASGQYAPCGRYKGYIGWVWPNRRDLSKL